MRGHYRFCFCVSLAFQFYVTRSEMNLVFYVCQMLFIALSIYFALTNTQVRLFLPH